MSLSSKLKQAGFDPAELGKPVWDGPSSDSPEGGVTSSLLSRYLACKERFRIMAIDGLKPVDSFSPRMEYGNMWHVCEESFARSGNPIVSNPVAKAPWVKALEKYAKELIQKYPHQGEQIVHWMKICELQFPIYIDWWKKHPDVANRTPIVEEEKFSVPFRLRSGRTAYLRGKWDSVDVVRQGDHGAIYLQENKSKADIDVRLIQTQLYFDLQTGVYSAALVNSFSRDRNLWRRVLKEFKTVSFEGVRYNVIRRPVSGGKGSIKQKKNQTLEQYYEELRGLIEGAIGPDWGMMPGDHFFFMRWKVEFGTRDIERFMRECLEPVLENLLDDYEWWNYCKTKNEDQFNYGVRGEQFDHFNRHYRLPFGVYNPLMEGGASEVDEYLATGSTAGLTRPDTLFPELK